MKVLFSSFHLNGHAVWFHLQTQELQPPFIAPPPPSRKQHAGHWNGDPALDLKVRTA